MKLIKKAKIKECIGYYYENGIVKIIFNDGEIFWNKKFLRHKEDGPAHLNCFYCINNNCFDYNKYNRHFILNNCFYSSEEFAEETKHIICKQCYNFCNQECFL